MSPFGRPFWVPFWSLFHKSGPRAPGPHPKVLASTNMDPKGTQMEPKGAPKDSQLYLRCVKMEPQWNPKATQSTKGTPQGPAKCHKDTHKCQQQAQLDTNNQKHTQ